MRLNARRRLAEFWSRDLWSRDIWSRHFWASPEAVAFSVGQSLAHASRRLQGASLISLLLVLIVQAALLGNAVRRADLAEQAAIVAAEQPTLVLRLAAVAANPQPDEDFATILAALQRNHTWLTTLPSEAKAPFRASPALTYIYAGLGYTLDARMGDLFVLAQRMHDIPDDAGATARAAELRRDAEGPLQDMLRQAAQLHEAQAQASLVSLRWLQGATVLVPFALIVVAAVLFRRMHVRILRVIVMLENLAGRDPLTGALSRNAFTARLRRMLLSATTDHAVGLILFDLDHFRALNNIEGDAAGDAMLRAIARRLRNTAGARATVVRLTGDSFAVALPGLAGGHAALAREAERISCALGAPVPYNDKLLRVGATAGTALAPQDTVDRGELVRMAEIAVLEAKQELRGSTRAFRDPDIEAHIRREALLHAITEPNFDGVTAWLQPVVRCNDRRVIGFEALARWEHPTIGRVPPAEFIPIAEASGRLALLSGVVRKAAFHALADFRAAGLIAPRLSLNLAPGEFARPATMRDLDAALAEAGLTPAALEIEVTEDALLGDPDNDALRALEDLRNRGARLVLDDFGVGFASLVHLQRFTVDALKIDRSFVAGLGIDPRADAIVRAIIGLARALGITTIAKGVETDAQAAFLKEHECDEMQGYLLAAPMAATDVADWLKMHHERA